jgi:abortive infection bacteriophage resistance protein
MKYPKPPLSFEQQAARLIERGMQGDLKLIEQRLASVNYYRLSGYWYPFRTPDDDSFGPNTTFDTVWTRYVFDRRLRLLVMDAVERIEIAVRTQLSYHHAHNHGPFGYATDPTSLPKLTSSKRAQFIERVKDETKRAKEGFVDHFKRKYGDHHDALPVWMATEIMSFGTVLSLYRGSSRRVKRAAAAVFDVPEKVFDSWLLTLNTIRNICAHHSRLWNRELGIKPLIPHADKYPAWHRPVEIKNNRVFGVLTICHHCMARIAPQSMWPNRLRTLLDDFAGKVPIGHMGFPTNWIDSPIWKDARR